MLNQLSSYELTEVMAYELFAGPVNNRWRDDNAAEMNYLLQWNSYLLGAQVTPEKKKNPVPEPHFPYRPWAPEEDEAEVDDPEVE